jgi:hypothetical protein
MPLNPLYLLFSLLFAGAHGDTLEARIAAHPRRPVFAPGQDPGEAITYRSGPYELQGTIYKPKGPGPFPAVLWNHGSEKNPVRNRSWRLFTPATDLFCLHRSVTATVGCPATTLSI